MALEFMYRGMSFVSRMATQAWTMPPTSSTGVPAGVIFFAGTEAGGTLAGGTGCGLGAEILGVE